MLRCDSAGIMCLLAASNMQLVSHTEGASQVQAASGSSASAEQQADAAVASKPLPVGEWLPSRVIELDHRGRFEVQQNWAYIDIGEMKTSLDYSKAVQQLGVRLKAMKYVACALNKDLKERDIRMVGRLFLPKDAATGGANAIVDVQQQQEATKMGYSLYLHPI
jgi:hypothetical protein